VPVLALLVVGGAALLAGGGGGGERPAEDSGAPVLEILDPAAESAVSRTPLATVKGRATDTDLSGVRMDGKRIPVDEDGSFEVSVTLAAGVERVVAFEAEDRAGHRSERLERRFTYEPPDEPEPAWRGPLGRAKEAAAAGEWRRAGILLREAKAAGAPAVEIPATLSEGVAAYERPPDLDVREPTEGADLRSKTVTVSGRLSTGRSTDRLFVDGEETAVESGEFRTEVSFVAWGPATIEVFVRDGQEERARVTRRVVLKEPAKAQPTKPLWANVSPEQEAEAARLGVPVAFENDLEMRFVLVPAGRFTMGSPEGESGRDSDEVEHEVTLTQAYYMQVTEVTNRQYRRWKEGHDSGEFRNHSLNGDDQPVVAVSHEDAVGFAAWLSGRGGGRSYRLPTEAEGERAARAGTPGARYWVGGEGEGHRYANAMDPVTNAEYGWSLGGWPKDDGYRVAAPVAKFLPNGWGLHDMLGNVWEWVADWYGPYAQGPVHDPTGPATGDWRVLRGGSWSVDASLVRAAGRDARRPGDRYGRFGFRLVSVVPLSGG
jgi:formylglycine-generating enzyme required for sulfatase activity